MYKRTTVNGCIGLCCVEYSSLFVILFLLQGNLLNEAQQKALKLFVDSLHFQALHHMSTFRATAIGKMDMFLNSLPAHILQEVLYQMRSTNRLPAVLRCMTKHM